MGKKLGNDYRLWIESATPGTFNEIKGNTTLTISRESQLIDTATKSDFPYGSQAPGLKTLTINAEIFPDLPDANGYGRLEAAALAATTTSTKFQIRKGGSAGSGTDVIFAASLYVGNFNTEMSKNDVVKCSFQLTLDGAPTTDALA
jgi:hypothetical protein